MNGLGLIIMLGIAAVWSWGVYRFGWHNGYADAQSDHTFNSAFRQGRLAQDALHSYGERVRIIPADTQPKKTRK